MKPDTALERATWLLERSDEAGIVTDLHGRIEYVNAAFEAMTGYRRAEVLGRTPALLKSGRQSPEFYRQLWACLSSGQEFHGVLLNRRHDGSLYHEEKTIRPLFETDGRVLHYMALGRDVSQREQALEKLHFDATHDGLTRLPNRTLFLDRLAQTLHRAARNGEHFAVALVDLNGFKGINDHFGHAAGDEALQAVAERLARSVRQADTTARLGGDEFALLLHDVHEVGRIMRTVLQACDEAQTLGLGHRMPLPVSVGVARYPEDGTNASDLMRLADEAMYRAKRAGGPGSRWAMAGAASEVHRAVPPSAGDGDGGGVGNGATLLKRMRVAWSQRATRLPLNGPRS
ncbi:MAG: diguanylate cyclase domain-containing protein [Inhella sp.]